MFFALHLALRAVVAELTWPPPDHGATVTSTPVKLPPKRSINGNRQCGDATVGALRQVQFRHVARRRGKQAAEHQSGRRPFRFHLCAARFGALRTRPASFPTSVCPSVSASWWPCLSSVVPQGCASANPSHASPAEQFSCALSLELVPPALPKGSKGFTEELGIVITNQLVMPTATNLANLFPTSTQAFPILSTWQPWGRSFRRQPCSSSFSA